MRVTISLILIIFLAGACKKDKGTVDLGYDYFPMEEGMFVLYDVQEIFHDKDLIPKHDTLRYKLKRRIGEVVLDNKGRKARKFFLTKYDALSGEVLDKRVWTRIIENGKGEIIEENQRKIRMIFAVKKEKEWDVNAFNTQGKELAYYEDVNTERWLSNYHFDETAKILYEDFLSLVDYRKKHEVYAKGVGLVQRSFKDLAINNFDTLNINKGTELHYRLIDYGKE